VDSPDDPPDTPLAKGFLSGTYLERPIFDHPEDNRGGRYQFSEEGFAAYQRVLDLIRGIADEKQASMAQIALAWMIRKKPWIVPIPGTRTVTRMKENLDAAAIGLTAADVQAIDDALNAMHLVDSSAKRIR
jgi:aryl-alcohol dehydrogenase-like predicted oxidoreductase